MANAAETSNITEILDTTEYSRLRVQSIERVVQKRSPGNEDVSYQFSDGSELLDFIKIGTRRESLDFRFESESLESQFLLMGLNPQSELSKEEFDIVRKYLLPIAALNNDLVKHHIYQSRKFTSMVKSRDLELRNAANTLAEDGPGYGLTDTVAGIQAVVRDATNGQKDMRTTHLLRDFQRSMGILDASSIEVWLKLPGYKTGITRAARLSRFAIHGDSGKTAVEPVIQTKAGELGLIPESLYIAPSVQLRVGNKHTRIKKKV
jgi:hypothetical protein